MKTAKTLGLVVPHVALHRRRGLEPADFVLAHLYGTAAR
jgi:hypothetical protein